MADAGGGMPATPRGSGRSQVAWIEIRANDLDRAAAFYGNVFGWELQMFGPSYRMYWQQGTLGMGFSSGLKPEMGNALFYVNVADIDASLAQAVELGAQVLEPKQPIAENMPNSGVFRTPAGVSVGMIDSPPAELPYIPAPWSAAEPPQPGSICSIEIHGGSELEETQRFYGDMFEWGLAEASGPYRMFDPGGSIGGVFQGHTPQAPLMVYIYVEDVLATLAKVKAAGGEQAGDPAAMPGMGMFGYFKDPNGVFLGLIGPEKA
ncbi:hypothetical protein KDL44_09925 [bacterium]|nr:hypothetical protein [bacterium]